MTIPEYPITREEMYLDAIAKGGGGGGDVTVNPLSVSENGTYTAPSGTAYSPVTVDVAATGYTADDWLDANKPTGAVSSNATTFSRGLLLYRTGITSLNLPNATSIPDDFCTGCTSLKSVYVPKVTSLGVAAFFQCTSLSSAHFPNANGTTNVFAEAAMRYIVIKSLPGWASNFARYNTHLQGLDMTGGDSFGNGTVSGDSALTTIVLRSSSVVALGNVVALSGTPFASGGTGGTLYVPSALIANYQSATNWSTILGYPNNQIKAIEGSVYETQYVDGVPIE
jgi:hypothetical protein